MCSSDLASATVILLHPQLIPSQLVAYTSSVLVGSVGLVLFFGIIKWVIEDSMILIRAMPHAEEAQEPSEAHWRRPMTPSCPLRFQFGSLFNADTGTVLTILQLSFEQVTTLVLMYRT